MTREKECWSVTVHVKLFFLAIVKAVESYLILARDVPHDSPEKTLKIIRLFRPVGRHSHEGQLAFVNHSAANVRTVPCAASIPPFSASTKKLRQEQTLIFARRKY